MKPDLTTAESHEETNLAHGFKGKRIDRDHYPLMAEVVTSRVEAELAEALQEAPDADSRNAARREGYDKLSGVLHEFGRVGPDEAVATVFSAMRELYRGTETEDVEQTDPEKLTEWQRRYHVAQRNYAEKIREHDSEYHAREELQAAFASNPSQDIWDAVTTAAEAEDQHGELSTVELAPLNKPHGGLAEAPLKRIPAEALVELADRVRNEPDPIKRYEIVTEQSPTGETWFETLPSFRSKHIEYAIKRTVHGLLGEGRKWNRGLDLGSGTGELAADLTEDCKSVTAVDRVEPLLDISKHRHGKKVKYVDADVTELPFPDKRFDLITSMGLAGSLDREAETRYYKEIGRLLKDGGVYLDGHYDNPRHPELDDLTETWKDLLGDMIVDTVSGKTEIKDRLSQQEIAEVVGEYGITITNGSKKGGYKDRMASTVRIFAKRAHLEKGDFGSHPVLVKD